MALESSGAWWRDRSVMYGWNSSGGQEGGDAAIHEHSERPLVLLRDFAFAGVVGQPFYTDWVPIDGEHQNAQIHVHCQTLVPSPAPIAMGVKVHSSFDMVEAYAVGSPISITSTGSQSAQISANLGPMVRVEILAGDPAGMYAVLSVWLQPKSD